MNPNVLTAAISTAGSMAIAITALVLNYSSFKTLSGRIDSIEGRFERRFESIERRLEVIEGDLKNFYKMQAEHSLAIARLQDKTR
jgi:hypothetical protein